jgi:hypothetical protein
LTIPFSGCHDAGEPWDSTLILAGICGFALSVVLPTAVTGFHLNGEPDGGGDNDAGTVARAANLDAGVGDSIDAGEATESAPDSSPDAEASQAPGPTAFLRGRVVGMGTRDPIEGASVVADGRVAGETRSDGSLAVAVTPGKHRLHIQFPGFEPEDLVVEMPRSEPLQIYLRPAERGERYETVVTARPGGTALPLSGEEAAATPGSAGDPFRTIESLPGVATLIWPLPLYAVRGANPGNTGFLLDGVKLPSLFHLALGPSVINPLLIDRLSFYPGSYPVQFGRYVGGLVAATTSSPPVDRPRAVVEIRALDSGAIVTSPLPDGRGSIALAGRYSYTGYLVSRLSSQYTLGYWDYQLRAQHTAGPGRITMLAFGAADELRRKDEPGTDAATSFHRLRVAWDGALAGGQFAASGAIGTDHTLLNLQDIMATPLAVRSYLATPRVQYSRSMARALELQVGLDGEVQSFAPQSQAAATELQDIARHREAYALGAFAAVSIRPTATFLVTPGLRTDVFCEQGRAEQAIQPRIEIAWRAGQDLWIKAAAGAFAQMPSLPVSVPGFEGFGLSSTGIQKTRQGSLGVESPVAGLFSGSATLFVQRGRLTDLKSIFDFDPQKGILEMRESRSYGIELLLRRDATHRFNGWISYTLSRSDRLVGDYGPVVPSDWDQRHILSVLGNYRLPGQWTLGARLHCNTGRPYPVPEPNQRTVDYYRLAPFLQLDVRVEKRFVLANFLLDAYLELDNATLTEQQDHIWREAYGPLRRDGFRIILPSLGIRAWF